MAYQERFALASSSSSMAPRLSSIGPRVDIGTYCTGEPGQPQRGGGGLMGIGGLDAGWTEVVDWNTEPAS